MIYKGHNGEYIELSELKKGSFLNLDNDLSYYLLFVWLKGKNTEITFKGPERGKLFNHCPSISAAASYFW